MTQYNSGWMGFRIAHIARRNLCPGGYEDVKAPGLECRHAAKFIKEYRDERLVSVDPAIMV